MLYLSALAAREHGHGILTAVTVAHHSQMLISSSYWIKMVMGE
jgi:hypothetical protein